MKNIQDLNNLYQQQPGKHMGMNSKGIWTEGWDTSHKWPDFAMGIPWSTQDFMANSSTWKSYLSSTTLANLRINSMMA